MNKEENLIHSSVFKNINRKFYSDFKQKFYGISKLLWSKSPKTNPTEITNTMAEGNEKPSPLTFINYHHLRVQDGRGRRYYNISLITI